MDNSTIPISSETYRFLNGYPFRKQLKIWNGIIEGCQAIQTAAEPNSTNRELTSPPVAGYLLAKIMGSNWIMYGRQGNPRILLPKRPMISYTNPQNTERLQLDLSLVLNKGLWNLISTLRPSGPQSGVAITMSHLSTTSADISLEGFDRSSVTSVTPSQGFWLLGGMLIEAVRAASRGGEYYLEYIYKSQMDELAKGLR